MPSSYYTNYLPAFDNMIQTVSKDIPRLIQHKFLTIKTQDRTAKWNNDSLALVKQIRKAKCKCLQWL